MIQWLIAKTGEGILIKTDISLGLLTSYMFCKKPLHLNVGFPPPLQSVHAKCGSGSKRFSITLTIEFCHKQQVHLKADASTSAFFMVYFNVEMWKTEEHFNKGNV